MSRANNNIPQANPGETEPGGFMERLQRSFAAPPLLGVCVGCGEEFITKEEIFWCVDCHQEYHEPCMRRHFKTSERGWVTYAIEAIRAGRGGDAEAILERHLDEQECKTPNDKLTHGATP